ncbi:hypothetical protein [Blastochloris sulfoviridis]|uniref:Transposase n=1 Tax=Blastochloris sulfoviridis TaxID=50712 RepID=A0A5M6HU99_9HYPH|nr:hypothetical protein [Blastochloris sulfoviridis]KAA5599218.1 hypothetical protein F1193_12360 [Blastochloris sulfoviridis]
MPMEPDAAGSLDDLPDSEFRGLIGRLVAEVSGLRATVAPLDARVTERWDENTALRGEVVRLEAENRTLKDEIARLKGLPPRPPLMPSGMERSTEAGRVSKTKRPRLRRRCGPVLSRISITEEAVLTAPAPAGSRFKGYGDIVVQDLDLTARAIRSRRESWKTPSGETVTGTLPAGIRGGLPKPRTMAWRKCACGSMRSRRSRRRSGFQGCGSSPSWYFFACTTGRRGGAHGGTGSQR